MKIAVLPFNAPEGTNPALGRQFSNMIAELVRGATGSEDVSQVSYLAQVEDNGVRRAAHVNFGAAVNEYEVFRSLFSESDVDKVFHGVLTQTGDRFKLHVRINVRDEESPAFDEEREFDKSNIAEELKSVARIVAEQAHLQIDEGKLAQMQFGTQNPDALLKYMEGLDGLQYMQQANGLVVAEYNPKSSIDALMEAVELDPEFVGPFNAAVQLCRACAHYRLGTFEDVSETLQKLAAQAPDDFRPLAALGEVYQLIGDLSTSGEYYEKAIAAHQKLGDDIDESALQERAALYSRLGTVQLNMGLPVNAERNLRKAVEIEAPEKPTLEILSAVLHQTNRSHEVPQLWRSEVDRRPQDAQSRAKYAAALVQAGQQDQGIAEFEKALDELEDSVFVKRYYAPMLAQMNELDRAMDFYEDCLDVNPTDVPLMVEYAQTLKAADREFEIPAVLKNILAANPDPNLRAQVLAWLVELEQPKRAEAVQVAREKVEQGDFEGAVRELKPLRNWLADYWKLWALLSTAYNQLNMPEDAEDAAQRLLNLYPAYEPAYAELMNALTTMGRNEDAYNAMRFAVANVPNSLGVTANLALAAKRAGHDEEAKSIAKFLRDSVGPDENARAELEPVLAEIER